jgi:hypothetical protein
MAVRYVFILVFFLYPTDLNIKIIYLRIFIKFVTVKYLVQLIVT